MKKSKSPEEFYASQGSYSDELNMLRDIVLETGLVETIKWGIPVYTYNNENVVGISAFKSYFGLWFYQGALLADPANKLINAQEGVTKAMRQYRMNHSNEIDKKAILQLLHESIDNFKDGRKIVPEKKKNQEVSTLLREALNENQKAKDQFESLTSFKQREYIEYIDTAKREATKISRLEKILPMIMEGKGLNDQYR